jgi:hypothetical protein
MKQKTFFSRSSHSLRSLNALTGIVAGLLSSGATLLHAQDANVLLDKLVQKGILSSQEGAEVRAEMQQDAAQSPASKIALSDSVTQLKIYGDLRYRYQYNAAETQPGASVVGIEQDRNRYRLRLNADVLLGPHIFAGVQLQTGATSDSGNQTYSTDFNNDTLYISRAFAGWRDDWLTVIIGKQANPLYTTDLLWDPDINPSGLTETIAFHKMPFFGGGSSSGLEKDPPVRNDPWEVTLVAGQFIAGDNSSFASLKTNSHDAWIFDQQLITKYKLNKNTSVTVAPGFLLENSAHITGANNTLPFTDEAAVISGTTAVTTTVQQQEVVAISYNAAGVPTKTITPQTVTTTTQTQYTPNNQTIGAATVSGPRTITSTAVASRNNPASSLVGAAAAGVPVNPKLAGQTFTTTTTSQTQTVSTTNNVTLPAVAAEDADLHILTAPGDISFTLAGVKTKLYWDFAYNVSGQDRYNNVYEMRDYGHEQYKARDSFAWLVGLEIGQIAKRGDWLAFVNYRQTGMSSVDPNLNDSDVAGSALNMQGFKFSLAYALTDSVVFQATEYLYHVLDGNIYGGRATSPGGIAPYRSYNETTLELNVKF